MTYDVESMYPSMKHAWLVKAIDSDEIMAEREHMPQECVGMNVYYWRTCVRGKGGK